MKVFISHKQQDSSTALSIQSAFKRYGIETYLDVLDTSINGGGKTLTEHIKQELNTCTDIIVVISKWTKLSWWVPFEIGMSAQIDMPTANYLSSDEELPSYLDYWPRLTSIIDIATYITVRNNVKQQMYRQDSAFGNYVVAKQRKSETPEFYRQLKQALRRP